MAEVIGRLAIVVGALLAAFPLLYGSARVILAIHGSAILGFVVYRLHLERTGRKLTPSGAFSAAFSAQVFFCGAFVVGSGLYGLVRSGSFEQGIGNFAGLLVTLWLMLGAVVSAGLALLVYGFQDPKDRPASPLEALCQRTGMSLQEIKCPKCGSARLQQRGSRLGAWLNYGFDGDDIALKCLDCNRRFVVTKLAMMARKSAP